MRAMATRDTAIEKRSPRRPASAQGITFHTRGRDVHQTADFVVNIYDCVFYSAAFESIITTVICSKYRPRAAMTEKSVRTLQAR